MSNQFSKPLITTIIPTYRRPKLLRRAIKSVLNQTYPHFQVCVYDNASGDETAEVVAEFAKKDPRVKYYCHKENIGMTKNFNFGLARVNTPFFSFLSDDDILLPNFYEAALKGFEKYPEAMFSATQTLTVNQEGQIIGYNQFFTRNPGLYLPYEGLLAMLKHYLLTWTGILFRREIIKKIGLLDEKIILISDVDFEYRIAARFPFFVSSELGAICQTHPQSAYSQIKTLDTWRDYLRIIKKLAKDESIPFPVRFEIKKFLIMKLKNDLFNISCRSLLKKDYEDADRGAEILSNHYHSRGRVLLLKSMIKICKRLPFVHRSLFNLNRFRKFLHQKNLEPLERKYKHLLTFLSY
jgi:glycosyltransferase involved in cell wall biosynthesis